jgi:tetratricopeptide (TPR) repeat protein
MISAMAEAGYGTASIAELVLPDGWSPIRRTLAIEAFGVNAWTAAEAGAIVIQEHDESSGHEELYVVVNGRVTFTVDGNNIDGPAGTLVFVRDPNLKRGAVAVEPGSTVLAVGAKPGEAFHPMSWEENAAILPLFGEGRYEEAKAMLVDALGRYKTDRATLIYNLACTEARLGEREEALQHLAEAFEERPDLRELALTDEDLESVREWL